MFNTKVLQSSFPSEILDQEGDMLFPKHCYLSFLHQSKSERIVPEKNIVVFAIFHAHLILISMSKSINKSKMIFILTGITIFCGDIYELK